MSADKLIAALADLVANRRLGLEASTALDPFKKEEFSLRFVFDSADRTFGNRLDSAYEGGKTVICKLEGIEVTVLLLPKENDRVDGLKPGDDLDAKVTPLDFDSLYQRAVLGQVLEESPEGEPTEEASPKVEDSAEEETTEEPGQQAPAEEPLPQEEPTAAAPEAPAEIPQATPEPAPPKPKEPEKFTITSAPSPKQEAVPPRKPTQEKPRKKRVQRKKPAPSRFAKLKKPSLRRIKEGLKKKIKKLRRVRCPNGHGPLTSYSNGKRYCTACGWPDRKSTLTASASASSKEARGEIEGCWKFGCIFVVLSFVLFFFILKLSS